MPSRAQLKDTGGSQCGLLEISLQEGGVGVRFSGISLWKMLRVPRKRSHAEKGEKRGLLCWHWPSERGPTGGGRAWWGSVPLGWLGNGLDASAPTMGSFSLLTPCP